MDNDAGLGAGAEDDRVVQPLTETVGATLAVSWEVPQADEVGALVTGVDEGGMLVTPAVAMAVLRGGSTTPAVVAVRGGRVARTGGSKAPPRVTGASPNDEDNGGGGIMSVLLRRRPGKGDAAVSSNSSFNGTEGLPTTVMVRRSGATMVGAGNAARAPLRAGEAAETVFDSAVSLATLRVADA
jgi:hypothetical protein